MFTVNNVTKIYKSKKRNDCLALDGISFQLPEKGLVFIIGKSGSGKSTLLNLLGGLDCPTSGEIRLCGESITQFSEKQRVAYRRSEIGFIFQDFHLLDNLTVEENIRLSLELERTNNLNLINDILGKVDLYGYNNRYPKELSGGEKQRVAIARALVKNPTVILADEPTGNLDSNTTKQVMDLIKTISKEKLVIIVSHNLYDAYDYADRIIELASGKILNDLQRNPDYKDEVQVVEDKLVLPMHKKLGDAELDTILNECKSGNVTSITQNADKFIKSQNEQIINAKLNVKDTNLSLRSTFNFSFLFAKKRIFSFVFSAILASLLIVVLAISQSISNFDSVKAMNEELSKSRAVYCIRKDLDASFGETALKEITDEEITLFEDCGADVYKLYNDSFPFYEDYTHGVAKNEISTLGTKSIYTKITFGTLQTTEEYAKKILNLDTLEIFTGVDGNQIEYKPDGIYVTDYIADCMLYYGCIHSYQDVLGAKTQGAWLYAYVNGIIKTNYTTRFKDILDNLNHIDFNNPTEEFLEFYDYISQVLAVGYTFEKDYKSAFAEGNSAKSWAWVFNLDIDGYDASEDVRHVSVVSYFNETLGEKEIAMDFELYNKIFDKRYTLTDVNEGKFVPHTVQYTMRNEYGKLLYKDNLTIAKLGKYSGSPIRVSDSVFKNTKYAVLHPFTLYVDTPDLSSCIQVADENDFTSNSVRLQSLKTMTKAVSVFNEFFEFIALILIISCVFILISFGVKNVKSNIYEIGVLKALGTKSDNLMLTFLLHTAFISIMIIAFVFVGYYSLSFIANDILIDSIKQLAKNQIINEIKFISFDINLFLIDSLIALATSMLATIIPIAMLKKIEPISIIKAKE